MSESFDVPAGCYTVQNLINSVNRGFFFLIFQIRCIHLGFAAAYFILLEVFVDRSMRKKIQIICSLCEHLDSSRMLAATGMMILVLKYVSSMTCDKLMQDVDTVTCDHHMDSFNSMN